MSSPSNTPIKNLLAEQQGAFSPFMFGLIMGITIFSALSMQLARQQMVDFQKKQAERAKTQAKDVADAMDFAILTETKDTYSDEYNLERAKQFANTTARTRGEQNFLVTERQDESKESYGQRTQKVAITASDDILLRSQVHRTESAAELNEINPKNNQPVVVYDTSIARDRQIRTSITALESLAEQVYAYYAAQMKFPNGPEFEALQSKFGLRDVWGQKFNYTAESDQQSATLGFTTPWGYTHSIALSLKSQF